jgi:hypothetical protein
MIDIARVVLSLGEFYFLSQEINLLDDQSGLYKGLSLYLLVYSRVNCNGEGR